MNNKTFEPFTKRFIIINIVDKNGNKIKKVTVPIFWNEPVNYTVEKCIKQYKLNNYIEQNKVYIGWYLSHDKVGMLRNNDVTASYLFVSNKFTLTIEYYHNQ